MNTRRVDLRLNAKESSALERLVVDRRRTDPRATVADVIRQLILASPQPPIDGAVSPIDPAQEG